MNEKKYEYKYWLTNLGDGKFDNIDKPLGGWLKDGYKPLREVNIGNTGYVLFVLSKKIEE